MAQFRLVTECGSFRLLSKHIPPGERVDWHRHRAGSITLVVRGTLHEEFTGVALTCGPWTFLSKPATARHVTFAGDQGVDMLIVQGSDRWLAGLGRGPAPGPSTYRDGIALGAVLGGFAAIEDRPADPDAAVPWARSLPAMREQSARLAEAVRGPAWLEQALELIRSLDPRFFSSSVLADAIGVHRTTLARGFRESFGVSVKQFVRQVRTSHAAERLVRSTDPVARIALDLGYADQSHFTRDFGIQVGTSPARLRRLGRRCASA